MMMSILFALWLILCAVAAFFMGEILIFFGSTPFNALIATVAFFAMVVVLEWIGRQLPEKQTTDRESVLYKGEENESESD